MLVLKPLPTVNMVDVGTCRTRGVIYFPILYLKADLFIVKLWLKCVLNPTSIAAFHRVLHKSFPIN